MVKAIVLVAGLIVVWFAMTAAVTLYHAPRFYGPECAKDRVHRVCSFTHCQPVCEEK